jgi:hypothetical protein
LNQGLAALGIVLLGFIVLFVLPPNFLQAQVNAIFQIGPVTPASLPAGSGSTTLVITGSLPNFQQQAYQVCFYAGTAGTAPITPTFANNNYSIVVPAFTLQAVPGGLFTGANNYVYNASLYIVPTGSVCDGNFDPVLTNNFPMPIVEPVLGGVLGSVNVPQTNSATGVPAAPRSVVLTGSGFSPLTYVTFGSFGNVTPVVISPRALSVSVPAAFAAGAAGSTASLAVCNTSGSGSYCNGAGGGVTLTVSAPVPSVGTVAATPTPTTTAGVTTLTAQFRRSTQSGTQLPEPGAPSGVVSFSAGGNSVGNVPLTLDPTAVFVSTTSTTQVPVTATPVIAPASGTFANSQTISITDATPGAAIFYTVGGGTPTTASQPYSGPFSIASSAIVQAIAVTAGYLNSGVASNTYTIFVPVATTLGFIQQPTTTAINTAIAPPVTVAMQDQNGNTITNFIGGISVALGSNPGQGTLSGTTTVNAVNGIATFSNLSINNVANGYTLAASSSVGPTGTSAAFNISSYPISVSLFDPLIGVTSTLPGTFTLSNPAPAGGVVVNLASSNTSLVTVSPATITVQGGQSTGSFSYTGVAAGPVNITASAPNYLAGSAAVTSTFSLVSLGTIPAVAPGQSVSLALSIATNAPAGGVTVNFTSSNPGVATVTSSVFIPQGLRTAAANPQIAGVTIGSTIITATAQGYAPDTRNVNVTVVATFSPGSKSINLATSNTITLDISAPAQTGGLTFTLVSKNPGIATVPQSVTIPQGQTSVAVPVTGVLDGSTSISADSPGVATATLFITVNSQIGFSNGAPITGVNLQNSMYANLPVTSPTPVTVTVTVSNPAIATISKSLTVVGGTTLTFANVASAGSAGTFYFQGQSVGSTTVTVSAPGYTTGTATITVYPSGFTTGGIYSNGLSTTSFSGPSGFTIYATILSPQTLAYQTTAAINPGLGPISVPVTSSNTTIGTITTSPVVFNAGDTSQGTSFQPSSAGTSTVSVGTPAGFSTPANYTQFTATVTTPVAGFVNGPSTTGVSLQVGNAAYLPVASPSPVTVTVTVSNPAIATISSSQSVVGGTSLTFANVTGSGSVATFYIQGQAVGTTNITVSATGYTSTTSTVTVNPSGFSFGGQYNGGLSTTSFSGPSGITVYPSILNPQTLVFQTTAAINPGLAPINVAVTSSNTATGTITTSPVIFNANDTQKLTSFQPSAAGTTTVAVGTPATFSTSANYQQFTATVTAPVLAFASNIQIGGVNMQVANYVVLPVAPPSPVTVTITSNGPAIAAISSNGTVVGGTTLTFPKVSAAGALPNFYVQGQSAGTTTLTVSAPGYTSGTATINIYPSGFTFAGTNNGGLSTTTFSTPTVLTVYATILNPQTLNYYSFGTLSPGVASINVPVTSSNTVVGTISASPLTFNAGDSSHSTTFQPTSAGSTTVSLGAPGGYSVPSNYVQFTATVSAPQLTFSNPTVVTGANLEITTAPSLPVAPPNPITVTVTSNGPAIATISKSGTVVGGTSLTFTNVTSAGQLPAIYVQGQSIGSTTLTVSAPGYTNGTATVAVNPSGFTFGGSYAGGLSTTTAASPTVLLVYPSILTPGSLTYITSALVNPGIGNISVGVTSSNTGVGTITTSPVIFSGGSSTLQTSFKSVAPGTTGINIVQPGGFNTPSQYAGFTATVQ